MQQLSAFMELLKWLVVVLGSRHIGRSRGEGEIPAGPVGFSQGPALAELVMSHGGTLCKFKE